MKPKEKPHYVNNRQFSEAVVDYCTTVKEAKDDGRPNPVVTDYIASCFLKIAEGLSHKANFVRYTYREEMVMDAVENCLKAIENYDIEGGNSFGQTKRICLLHTDLVVCFHPKDPKGEEAAGHQTEVYLRSRRE